jgi:hypothetical protein
MKVPSINELAAVACGKLNDEPWRWQWGISASTAGRPKSNTIFFFVFVRLERFLDRNFACIRLNRGVPNSISHFI